MSGCCSNTYTEPSFPSRARCPINGKEYTAVSMETIKYHISEPWKRQLKDQEYYFCSDPQCEVVYFADDGTTVKQSEVRTRIGIKAPSGESVLCYCFGITAGEALAHPELKAFVVEETRRKMCACETHNPSGKCCLAEFPKIRMYQQ